MTVKRRVRLHQSPRSSGPIKMSVIWEAHGGQTH
eukprot:CAMPEP_0177427540 /NCGR_PEP_ID=MMETSP0368-20130122/74109_1 /TAXON_ID=447022 ORGANISM="Scrippsiella hangoei-like, Strain SHHI-4" /NCGR_SAMPLE_ID=MMETSP0368 /ASSEMBLY_ACC=CAM_ASM_000363 /LENGTH=33 /DNA_ID= /DNA_START= /DNA_END= /DNA_ORIENTATION=